jgi:hypothetical protein
VLTRVDLAEADLPSLCPDASPEQLDRIRWAAERVQPATWLAGSGEVDGSVMDRLLIGTVDLGLTVDDQLEIELTAGHVAETEKFLVSATIAVWCRCPQDHNMHYVRNVDAIATTVEELAAAVEAAADLVAQWRDTGPRDPDWWRTEAGLPLTWG